MHARSIIGSCLGYVYLGERPSAMPAHLERLWLIILSGLNLQRMSASEIHACERAFIAYHAAKKAS